MARHVKYGCPPATAEEAALNALLKQRERLLTLMTSGVAEIEQPQLGRTQYRSIEEMQVALRQVDDLIAQLGGGAGAAAGVRARRPVYPVVREV